MRRLSPGWRHVAHFRVEKRSQSRRSVSSDVTDHYTTDISRGDIDLRALNRAIAVVPWSSADPTSGDRAFNDACRVLPGRARASRGSRRLPSDPRRTGPCTVGADVQKVAYCIGCTIGWAFRRRHGSGIRRISSLRCASIVSTLQKLGRLVGLDQRAGASRDGPPRPS